MVKRMLCLVIGIMFLFGGNGDCGVLTGGSYAVVESTTINATDDFNRADSNTLGSLSGGTYTWVETQNIDIISNRAQGINDQDQQFAVLSPSVSFTNGTLSVIANRTTSTYNSAGIIVGYTDSSNYHYVRLTDRVELDGEDTVAWRKVVSGVDTLVATGSATINSGQNHTLSVVKTGTTLVISVDGSEKINTSDASLGNGNVGIYCRRYATCDDFSAVSS